MQNGFEPAASQTTEVPQSSMFSETEISLDIKYKKCITRLYILANIQMNKKFFKRLVSKSTTTNTAVVPKCTVVSHYVAVFQSKFVREKKNVHDTIVNFKST